MKHPALMQDVLSLLSHTTHQMPLTDEQPLQSTADRIRALTARYGDRNNRILQQAVVEVLKADGVWEAAKALLQGPTSAPAEVSAFPFPGAQAAPVPQAANDNRIAQTVVTALLEADEAARQGTPVTEEAQVLDEAHVPASADEPSEQDERLLFQALQHEWRKNPRLSWLSAASETQQKNWLQLSANREYAAEQLNRLLQLPRQRALDDIRNELAERGHDVFPAESILLSAQQTVMGQAITVNTTLAELAMKGLPSDPSSPWLSAQVYLEDESGVTQADAAFAQDIHELLEAGRHSLSEQSADQSGTEYEQELRELRTSRQVRDAHYRWLLSDFYLSSLTAELKGTLTGGRDAYVRGLDIIKAAQHDDPGDARISAGTFTFFDSSVQVPIRNWLAIIRYDAQGQEDGVVLYNAAQNQWSVFDDQFQLSQHLDLTRLSQHARAPGRQTRDGQVDIGTIPLLRAVLDNADERHLPQLRQSLQEIVDRPDRWSNDRLAFTPYSDRGFNEGMQHFSKDLLESNLARLASAYQHNPLLQKHADDNALLSTALQAFVHERLPFSLSLDEFARRQVSADIAPWFVANGLASDASEVDAATIQVTFNGVTASLPEWALNLYRQAGDTFGGPDFRKEAEFSSSTGQDLSALQRNEAVKESLEGYLRRTYLGDQYAEQVRALLAGDHPLQKSFQDLRVAKEASDLRVALEAGKATGYIPNADYSQMDRLLRSLPDSASTPDGRHRIGYFAIRGIRIPGMYEITLADSSGRRGRPAFKRRYVYTPEAVHGRTLHEKTDFLKLLKHSPPMRDAIVERALIKDRTRVDNALRAIQTNAFTTDPLPMPGFAQASDQLIGDHLDNADERTTSRLEMIEEQIFKGASYATTAACLTAGPVGAVACAVGTGTVMTKNMIEVTRKAQRGHLDQALWDAALIWADAPDIAAGFRPAKGLLKALGKAHFGSVDEVIQAIETTRIAKHGFLRDGHLNPTLAALNVRAADAVRSKPRASLPGDFYLMNNKYYVQDNGRMFEVFSDSGWTRDSIRLRDSQHPHAQGPLIEFRNGRWQQSQMSLKGGSDDALRPEGGRRPDGEQRGRGKPLARAKKAQLLEEKRAQHAEEVRVKSLLTARARRIIDVLNGADIKAHHLLFTSDVASKQGAGLELFDLVNAHLAPDMDFLDFYRFPSDSRLREQIGVNLKKLHELDDRYQSLIDTYQALREVDRAGTQELRNTLIEPSRIQMPLREALVLENKLLRIVEAEDTLISEMSAMQSLLRDETDRLLNKLEQLPPEAPRKARPPKPKANTQLRAQPKKHDGGAADAPGKGNGHGAPRNRIEIQVRQDDGQMRTLTGKPRPDAPDVVDILDRSGQRIHTYIRSSNGQVWVRYDPTGPGEAAPEPTVPSAPTWAALYAQSQRLLKETEHGERTADFVRRRATAQPSTPQGLLQYHANRLKTLADNIDDAVASLANDRERTLADLRIHTLRHKAQDLLERGWRMRKEMILAQAPTPDRLDWLITQGVTLGMRQVQTRVSLTRQLLHPGSSRMGKVNDYLDEVEIRVDGQLWAYAHLHYASADAKAEDFTAAHLKKPSQRFQGASAQAIAEQQGRPFEIHRAALSKHLVEVILRAVDASPIGPAAIH